MAAAIPRATPTALPDFVKLAEAFGADRPARRRSVDEVDDVIREMLRRPSGR